MISKTHLTVNSSVLDFNNIFSASKYFPALYDTLLNFVRNLCVICISEIYVLFLPFEQIIVSSRIIMTASTLDYISYTLMITNYAFGKGFLMTFDCDSGMLNLLLCMIIIYNYQISYAEYYISLIWTCGLS